MEETVRITEDRSSSWDCQITAIVVGECAGELRQHNYAGKLLHQFVRVSDYCLCLVFVWTVLLAHLLIPHIGSPHWLTPHAG